MYPLGIWFVSGICVWIPCLKEAMMVIIIIIIIIIVSIRIPTKLKSRTSIYFYMFKTTVLQSRSAQTLI